MNPARSLAPAVVSGHLQSWWGYLVSPRVGAAVAVPFWHVTRVEQGVEAKEEVSV
jgi:aquaporin NIP